MPLEYKRCPCGTVIDDAQKHCSDECADMPALKAQVATLTRALAESRGRMRAVLVDKAKMLKQEDCDCGAEGGTLESGTAEVVCHGHEILEAMSKALTTPTPPQQERPYVG